MDVQTEDEVMDEKENFLALLKANGLTQYEFADLVQMHKGTINTWGAKRPVPHWAMLLLTYRQQTLALSLRMMS